MSKLARMRKQWEYETDVPRCATCINYSRPPYRLANSLPLKTYAVCRQGGFTIAPNSVCNKWEGKDGSVLESAAPTLKG